MTTYAALLRGINLGSVNKVPMRELRTLCEDLGHDDVRTYLQSGNVVFESGSSPQKIASGIEAAIAKSFDLRITVIMRTHRDLQRVVAGNPFPTSGAKPSSLHVMFLAEPALSKAVKVLDPDRCPPDEFKVKGREIYLRYPNGMGRSKLTIDYFEKSLSTRATARNWNTVTKLLALMKGS